MKRLLILFIVCSIENQINSIRPNANYVIHSGDYAGIEWLDKVQIKPTPAEMDAAESACHAQNALTDAPKLQAITDAKNVILTPTQRIDALTKILGL